MNDKIEDALSIGTIVKGKAYSYKIRKVLGQGSFGITYLASVKMSGALGTLDTEVFVAIKEFFMKEINGREDSTVITSSKDGAFSYYKSKFIHEAENLSRLKHPNIIKVVESFEGNNTAYYVMEYVEGGSLDELINKSNGLSESECIKYSCQIGKALEYMHSHKMLHLDLKPNNIMLHKNGQIVLIDFGLAKQFGADGKPETSTTIGYGTPGYAPIEQANYRDNQVGIFPATMDIYAFGATMYKILTGHRPVEASIILNDGFPVDEFKHISCSKQILDIVQKCMSPIKKDRYQKMTELLYDINRVSCNNNENTVGDFFHDKTIKCRYKKKIGEAEYGSAEVIEIPLTETIDFPSYIDIKFWRKDNIGNSFQFILSDGSLEDKNLGSGYYNIARIWSNGKLVNEHKFGSVIPKDVKNFIVEHGFLSTTHWENESKTSPIGVNFGIDVSIRMLDNKQREFVRRVQNAHKDWHNILLNEIEALVQTTSLSKELYTYINFNQISTDSIIRSTSSNQKINHSPTSDSDETILRKSTQKGLGFMGKTIALYNRKIFGLIGGIIGCLMILMMESYVHGGIFDFSALDTDGVLLLLFFLWAAIGISAYFFARHKKLEGIWRYLKGFFILAFIVNTLLLGIWNSSLTAAYLILSIGLLWNIVILSLYSENHEQN